MNDKIPNLIEQNFLSQSDEPFHVQKILSDALNSIYEEIEKSEHLKNSPEQSVQLYLSIAKYCIEWIKYDNDLAQMDIIKNENSRLEQEIARLNLENTRLQTQVAHLSQRTGRVGRPSVYDSAFRQRVIDFYNESPAHTYQITAQTFNISTNTVGRILKGNA